MAARDLINQSSPESSAASTRSEFRFERHARRGGSDWRDSTRAAQRWGGDVLGWALIGLGVGVLSGAIIARFVAPAAGEVLPALALWTCLGVPVILAFRRMAPRPLLQPRVSDIVIGLTLGLTLRLADGWIAAGFGSPEPWPSYAIIDGRFPLGDAGVDLVMAGLIGPTIEELFFRGLILVAIFTALRRPAGRVAATIAAVLISTGLFVLSHSLGPSVTLPEALSLTLLALITAFFVFFTGRIWPAVLIHAVYNLSWVALATVGTLVSPAAS